jgi:hypothetical protein
MFAVMINSSDLAAARYFIGSARFTLIRHGMLRSPAPRS